MIDLIKWTERIILFSCVIYWLATADNFAPLLTTMAILVHEIGHVLTSWYVSCGLNKIKAGGVGLRLFSNKAYTSYNKEALIALGGPLFNIISAISSYMLTGNGYFVDVSLSLALINLLPIKTFDGSKILNAVTADIFPWSISELICNVLSFLALFSVWCASVYVLIRSGKNIIPFLFSIFIFIKTITGNENF